MFNFNKDSGSSPFKQNIENTDNSQRSLPEKESCILIIQARIRDLRALEKYMIDQKIPIDKVIIAKKIGGLRKCIEYIQNH